QDEVSLAARVLAEALAGIPFLPGEQTAPALLGPGLHGPMDPGDDRGRELGPCHVQVVLSEGCRDPAADDRHVQRAREPGAQAADPWITGEQVEAQREPAEDGQ